jgi:poly(3-hydroxybutyrate) depolymerase
MPVSHHRRAPLIRLRLALLVVLAAVPNACAFGPLCKGGDRPVDLRQLNARLAGRVDDYTANHGSDNRIDAPSLGQKRDVYVYVPPGYDPAKRYPLVVWLHGLNQDETSFLEIAPKFDQAMVAGTLPKFVAVAPDGTANNRTGLREPPTLYLNSPLGRFADFVAIDVWNHVVTHYSIRPERQAHVLAGASMGGFGAYNLGIKNKSDFGVIAGVLPPINLRYADCHGRIDTDFDPNCLGWVTDYQPNAVVARFGPCGIIKIRERQLIAPVFGEGPDVIAKVAAENPAEMLAAYKVKPGELEMFAGYASRDEFNFDAHAESFAFLAQAQGLTVTTVKVSGKHDKQTGFTLLPAFVDFLRPRLEPYAPKD